MKKKKIHVFNKDAYLLGEDASGRRYWLEEAKWDCEWYWGGGYVETYTNNRNPEQSRDIASHQHFDGMFFSRKVNGYDAFKAFFKVTPFTDKEIWEILELMQSFYTARRYSDMLSIGGAHYTANPASETIKSPAEYDRINDKVIPAIMAELYKILGGDEEC